MRLLIVYLLAIPVALINSHGYVSSPPSRSYLCKTKANLDCDFVSYEPQSIEAKKNLLEAEHRREVYGRIASAGIQRFAKLDEF
ncbi:hypothetical protein KPH14_013076, partial [Odynerus spinipes]